MGLALLTQSVSYLATTFATTNVPTMATKARMISISGFGRCCIVAFQPNAKRQFKRFSSLRISGLQFSSLSSTMAPGFDGVSLSPPPVSPLDENYFLDQVEATVSNVFASNCEGNPNDTNILDLPVEQREAFGVALHVDKRLRSLRKNNDCPRCWMQRYHCICGDCHPVLFGSNNASKHEIANNFDVSSSSSSSNTLGRLKRIFLVVHHKEIGLKVDTAKLILAAFPFRCELIVGGIGPEHQASMKKMLESLEDSKRTSLLLFPDDTARTLEEIVHGNKRNTSSTTSDAESLLDPSPQHENSSDENDDWYDLIVLDGTWAQARKFHLRYFPSDSSQKCLRRVKLSEASVELLQGGSIESGHQLRRHDIPWRQVGTFEAFRLFLRDWCREFPSAKESGEKTLECWEQIESYQTIANNAALRELGPPRS